MNEGALVQRLRERARVSQQELARRLGVSQRWVSGRETNATRTTLTDLERISAAVGIEFDPAAGLGPDQLTRAAATASAEAVELASQLLRAHDRLGPDVRALVASLIREAAGAAMARQAG